MVAIEAERVPGLVLDLGIADPREVASTVPLTADGVPSIPERTGLRGQVARRRGEQREAEQQEQSAVSDG